MVFIKDRDKLFYAIIYNDFLDKLKEIREEYYEAQKSFYTTPTSRAFCGDECTCKNLRDLEFAVEREIFLKVCGKLHRINGKMHDFNLLCDSFMSNIFENNMNSIRYKLDYRL